MDERAPFASPFKPRTKVNGQIPNKFSAFQIPPPEPSSEIYPVGEVTLCELDGNLVTIKSPSDENIINYHRRGGVLYPDIQLSLPANITNTNTNSESHKAPGLLSQISSFFSFDDQILQNSIPNLAGYHNRNVQDSFPPSPVKSLNWHPNKQLLAVSLTNDVVYFYDLTAEKWSALELKSHLQTNITQVEWRPNYGTGLAVSCLGCVCVWTIKKRSPEDDFYYSTMLRLESDSRARIDQLTWSPDGKYLACFSHDSDELIIWDVDVATQVTIRCGPCGTVRWSPSGGYVVAGLRNGFIIFETQKFSAQKFINNLTCQSICWNGDGRYFVISFKNSTSFFTYSVDVRIPNPKSCKMIRFDELTPYEVTLPSGRKQSAGGPILQLEWDRNSERLAVTIDGDSPGSSLVALFVSQFSPSVDFLPRGWIRGPPDSKKAKLAFVNCLNNGSLLTLAWNTGKLSFVRLFT